MSKTSEKYALLPFSPKGALTSVMAACSAYNERRTWFAAQPKSGIKKGVWSERKEAPEMMRLSEDLVRSLFADSGLCVVRTRETDLGLAPRSSLLSVMWGDVSIVLVFYGGRLTVERLEQIDDRIPNKNAAVVLVSIEPPDFAPAERLTALRANGRPIVLVSPTDVDALASGRWSVINMICYKLLSSLLLGQNDQQTIYDCAAFEDFLHRAALTEGSAGPVLDAALATQDLPPDEWLAHPIAPELVASVSTSDVTFLLGTSASGKSTLALSVGLNRQEAGEAVYFIDAGAISDVDILAACVRILTIVQSKSRVLLIVDDMQSNPRIASNLLAWIRGMQCCGLTQRLRFLGVTWPEFISSDCAVPTDADIHIIAASQMTPAMLDASRDSLDESQIDFAVTTSGSDLLVLRLVLNALSANMADLTRTRLASLYCTGGKERTLSASRRIWQNEPCLLRLRSADTSARFHMTFCGPKLACSIQTSPSCVGASFCGVREVVYMLGIDLSVIYWRNG